MSKDFLTESYEQVLNEGLWDRTKAAASGALQSTKNLGGNIKGGFKAGVAGATGDVKGAQDAATKVAQQTTGKDTRKKKLIDLHVAKANKFADNVIAKLDSLAKDFESDMQTTKLFDEAATKQNNELFLKAFLDKIQAKYALTAKPGAPEAPPSEAPKTEPAHYDV